MVVRFLIVLVGLGLFLRAEGAEAADVQIEPDNFPPGTNLSHVSSAARLFSTPGPTDIFVALDPNAPTGDRSFSRSPDFPVSFSRFLSPKFKVEFLEPVSSVSLDFRSFSSVPVEAIITAFDSGNNILDESRELFASFDFSGTKTVTVTSATPIRFIFAGGGPGELPGTVIRIDNLRFEIPDPSVTDTCDIGGGPNDIEALTASYDTATDEVVVEMDLCTDADNRTKYQAYFDHQDTTNLDGDGIDDGPDTLDSNPECVRTWDDKMTHKGRKDWGPGTIDVDGGTLTYRVAVDDLNPGLAFGDTVLVWADTRLKKTTDRAPNTESGDGCAKPEVATEVLPLVLR